MTPGPRGNAGWAVALVLCAMVANAAVSSTSTSTMSMSASDPTLRFDADPASPAYGTIRIDGLDPGTLQRCAAEPAGSERWPDWFAVYTGDAAPEPHSGKPTLLGRFQVREDAVVFVPRFPPMPGQSYHAVWRGPDGGPIVSGTFRVEREPLSPTAEVAGVFPSDDELPANLLKFYIQFSERMSRGQAASHIRLLDARGDEVDLPFVAPEHELWNGATDRLTLFFDPGRIKRGVGPNETLGSLLQEGASYTLVVDRRWRDAQGTAMRGEHRKRFRVRTADRRQPREQDWAFEAPLSSADPLLLRFPEPMDRALIERLPTVVRADGTEVAGRVTIEDRERTWRFVPEERWPAGQYRLQVSRFVEDLAGNSPARPFELEMQIRSTLDDPPEPIVYEFVVGR